MMIDFRYSLHPDKIEQSPTDILRKEYLIQNLFIPGRPSLVLSDQNQMLIGGVMPTDAIDLGYEQASSLPVAFKHREMGIFNVGGPGAVETDSGTYALSSDDALYVGTDNTKLLFHSSNAALPAKFYFNSVPAHKKCPTTLVEGKKLTPAFYGESGVQGSRYSYRYIANDVVEGCQLAMGISAQEQVWVCMPPHLHTSHRMEVYLYTGFPEDCGVFHFMGKPGATRHLAVKKDQAVIAPSWSVHAGIGNHRFSIIWGTCGEAYPRYGSQVLSFEALGG